LSIEKNEMEEHRLDILRGKLETSPRTYYCSHLVFVSQMAENSHSDVWGMFTTLVPDTKRKERNGA
jgi:hypothetical protein